MSKYKFWTEDQVKQLLSLYGTIPTTELAKKLKKSVGSVYYILNKEGVDLKLSYWSERDVRLLKDRYSNTSNQILSDILNRSEDAVQFKAASLNLHKDKFWTEDEIQELRDMKSAGVTYADMSTVLNKTEGSIHNQLVHLGLTKDVKRWTDEELTIIRLMASKQQYTYADIAHQVLATPSQVRAACYYHGWHKDIKRSKSIGEEQLIYILEEIFPDQEVWEQFYIGEGLLLDVFLPHISMGFEYDGQQHFQFTPVFHRTEDDFIRGQYLDERKDEICQDMGIGLVRIRFDQDITKELLIELIQKVGQGSGSKQLDLAIQHSGNYSKGTLALRAYHAKIKDDTKKRRTEYLKSDFHKQQLRVAKEFRQQQYKRAKELKQRKDGRRSE